MSKSVRKKHIVVFTDGSCAGNGKQNASGGIGIHFPNGELTDVSKIYRNGYCTNQKTELFAILTALRYINQNLGLSKYKVLIKTDSDYSINCVTKWVYGWIKNGWKTQNNKPVANKEYIEAIHKYYENYDITFEHVDAHTGLDDDDSIANARADELATKATKKAIKEMRMNHTSQKPPQGSKSVRNYSDTRSKNKKKTNYSIVEEYSPQLSSSKNTQKKNNNFTFFPKNNNFVVELVKSKN
ncbi:ribonuclease H [Tupanvirus deep ocean]|uniref:Ribonuclease H n=2 Tax=Tupanvirus TaxID=2094720 RepID=A0AC62A7T3_9VIRU|nr:ribonuclease H [Tupanvirus deep ocean]QKU33782.1 ribonuclease H [Tupanvirus deep ocean]